MQEVVETIFGNIHKWKTLPAYQAERRIDLLLSVYLKDFVQSSLQKQFPEIELLTEIIPEFPVPKLTFLEKHTNKDSRRTDYLLISKDFTKVIFLELKTDEESADTKKQIAFLKKLPEIQFTHILEALKEVYLKTGKRKKYLHLFKTLKDAGLVELLPDGLESITDNTQEDYVSPELKKLTFKKMNPEIVVCYLAPQKTKRVDSRFTYLSLIDFAIYLTEYKKGDKFAELMADFLKQVDTLHYLE